MRPIYTALLATTIITPTAYAAPVDLIATFDVNAISFAPEETQQEASELTDGNDNPFDNDFSGGFMSPQTGTGSDDTSYADGAAERELREGIFVDGLPYGGAQWNGDNNSGVSVPLYEPVSEDDPYAGDDFVNKWVLPENVWEFDEITARFVLDSEDFGEENYLANVNNDVVDDSFSLLDSDVSTLFETDALGSLFLANSGDGLLLRNTGAVALNSTGEDNDILVIAGIEGGDQEADDPSVGLYATVFIGESNWFETVFGEGGEGNLLESLGNEAYNLTSQFVIEDRLWGTDENGYTPLGTFEIVGEGTSLTTETSGASEQSALLPDAVTTEDGGFTFEVAIVDLINDEGIVWIDPDIATGYVYKATQTIDDVEQNAVFTAVQAPGLDFVKDANGYTLTVTHIVDDNGDLVELPDDGNRPTYSILPGHVVSFGERVGIFELTGIDEALMLDPENGLVFQTGLGFENTAGIFSITQTPITTFVGDEENPVSAVPLPMPALMLLTGLGGLAAMRRRRKSA